MSNFVSRPFVVSRIVVATIAIVAMTLVTQSSPAYAVSGNQGLLVPVDPVRIADTRPAPLNVVTVPAQIPANTARTFAVAGLAVLPAASQISAVALNVTVTNVAGPGFITVYPNAGTPPTVSNLNFEANETRAAHVVVALSAAGTIEVYSGVSASDIVIDVSGYYMSAGAIGTGYMLETPSTPSRLFDSRTVGTSAAIPAGGERTVCVSSLGTPRVVALNITMVAPSVGGFITAWPTGSTRPTASVINAAAGEIVSNYVVVPVGTGSCISLYSNVQVHYVADLFARWVAPVALEGRFVPLATPVRYYDTRNNSGIPPNGVSRAGEFANLQIGGKSVASVVAVPTTARAVLFNLTTTQAFANGFMTVYRSGEASLPGVSNINFVVEQALPNMVLTRINPSVGVEWTTTACTATGSGPQVAGCASFYHHTGGNFIVDVAGYFTAS